MANNQIVSYGLVVPSGEKAILKEQLVRFMDVLIARLVEQIFK